MTNVIKDCQGLLDEFRDSVTELQEHLLWDLTWSAEHRVLTGATNAFWSLTIVFFFLLKDLENTCSNSEVVCKTHLRYWRQQLCAQWCSNLQNPAGNKGCRSSPLPYSHRWTASSPSWVWLWVLWHFEEVGFNLFFKGGGVDHYNQCGTCLSHLERKRKIFHHKHACCLPATVTIATRMALISGYEPQRVWMQFSSFKRVPHVLLFFFFCMGYQGTCCKIIAQSLC